MLSDMQRNVQKQIELATNEETKFRLKIYQNRIMTEIHRERKQKENVKVRTFLQPLINNQNYQRMYEAVKNINKMRPKQPLVIKSDEGLKANGETQTKTIAKYFTDSFWKDTEPMLDLRPTEMSNPFTSEEIKKAVSKMKMNKSPGCDEIPAELIMYVPDCVYESIAEIFNQIASDGDCPKEINHGILVPSQKPGKPRGPAPNLRPIIFLSTLRKILAVCIMDRVDSRLDHETPIAQAAYRKERSTTEQAFAVKMVIERTTNARNETLHLVLLYMSKAFDTIKRKDLIEHLQHTIEADELHIMKKMLEVSLVVRCGDSISEPFHTDTGAPQGDCASANSFTYYLAKSIEV